MLFVKMPQLLQLLVRNQNKQSWWKINLMVVLNDNLLSYLRTTKEIFALYFFKLKLSEVSLKTLHLNMTFKVNITMCFYDKK